LNPIGHGHYSGKNGKLFTDLSSLTTALKIVKSLKVKVK
jgi:polyphosphate kinase